LQDHGLVAVGYLQIVLVAQLQEKHFLLLKKAVCNFQFADPFSSGNAQVTQRFSTAVLALRPQMLHSRDYLWQALAAFTPTPFSIGK
jgi:hypothetical protein